ncbi:MAG: dihydrofolate reductase family protein [Actinobacteria bacterium]|nr:dihydrofolate reductase family protein [Actinomycetota bacterium]
MRQLLPVVADDVDPVVVYADLPAASGRPAVRLNMIASLDGAATVEGLSGGLGGPADHRVFAALRELTDVVLVAAGTVRAERYGPSKVPLAIVTRSCALDLDAPLFVEGARAIVLTVAAAPPKAIAAAREVADVLVAGERTVDLGVALQLLGEAGHRNVLAEGGPSLNAQLAAGDLIDELCLTIAPCLLGGDSRRILAGPPVNMNRFALHTICEESGYLFLRLRRVR